VYGSVTDPGSDAPVITLTTNITATTSATQYKIRVTPKSHAAMPVPAGSSYAVTARISAWSGTVAQTGSDTAGTTVTIDNLSPGNVTAAAATPGNAEVALSWTNPGDADLGTIVVLRRAGAAVGDTPVEGATYNAGDPIGSSTVALVVTAPTAGGTDTGLTNGTVYHYKIFARDTNGNYAATDVVPSGSPATPNVTTLGDGTDPGNVTLAPGGAATMADAFTFQTASSSDAITDVTVTLAAGTSGGLSLVEITDDGGGTVYGSVTDPGSDTPVITLTTNITATTSATQYKIRVTPKSHAAMPVPAGSSYAVTARITAWSGTIAQTGSDTAGTTVTIDNLSPGNVTAAAATPGDTQVSLSWTNPGDADLGTIIVLRRAGAAVGDTPVEGASYNAGDPIGSSTVALVVTAPTAGGTDTGLANGTVYHYKIFARDTNGNYAATGVVPSGSPATPAVAISGTVYTDEGVTAIADGATVNLLVNGTSVGTDTTTSGTYSIPAPSLAANDTLLVYIDGHASKGTTVSISDGLDLSVFDIYAGHIITRHDNSGALSNANLSTAKSVDTDIQYSVSGGALTVDSGVELYVASGHSFTPGGNVTTQDTGGNVDLRGTITAGTNTFTVADDWTNSGTFTANTSTIIFNGSDDTTFTPGASATYKNITVNKDAQTNLVTLSTDALTLASSSALTLTTGILDLAGNSLDLGTSSTFSNDGTLGLEGDEILSNFTNDIDSGTIEYNGSGSYTGLIAGDAYYHLTYDGTGTWTLDAALDVDGDFTITSGTVDTSASSFAVNVASNWTNSGTFTAQTGTVTLDGTGQSITGDTTFYNLTKSVAAAETLTFGVGSTQTINGTVTLNGASANLLSLVSSSPGTHWNFNVAAGATKAIDYVDVSWSDASGSDATQKPINPTNFTDGGDTVDWFGAPDFLILKASTTISDPVNGGTLPKAIPGAVVGYSVIVTNNGDGSPDTDTLIFADPLDSVILDYDVTTGVTFTDGATSSALALGAIVYSQTAAPGPYTYDYTPVPVGGYDGNVTSIKVNTTGTFAFGGAPSPSFTLKFRVRVK
jgi:hypothetical protein